MSAQSRKPIRILLAVDGSEDSKAAAQHIRELPLPPASEITMVGVLTLYRSPGRAELLAAFDELRRIIEREGILVKDGFLHGNPAEELANYAVKYPTDLIMVGARGLHATLNIFLGGVAQQVVEYAQRPVWVVRSPASAIKRILLVTDGSSSSRRAAEFLAWFPIPTEAQVSIMHVLPPQLEYDHTAPGTPVAARPVQPKYSLETEQAVEKQVESYEQKGQAILDDAVETLRAGGLRASGILARGEPAGTIIEYVKTHQIDQVVAGSRGLSAVKGWLLGSVSRKLVHYAECSVLVVREEPEPDY